MPGFHSLNIKLSKYQSTQDVNIYSVHLNEEVFFPKQLDFQKEINHEQYFFQ